MAMADLTIIIPARNEAKNLEKLVPGWLEFAKQNDCRLIIVNDGSTDNTRDVLARFPADDQLEIAHHKVRRGYGGAIKTGISRAKTDLVLTFDADGQHQLPAVQMLYEQMAENNADMVIGRRTDLRSAGIYKKLGRALILRLAGLLFGLKIHDLNSGLKIFRSDLAKKYVKICPNSMAFSDIIALTFISEGNLVLEYPIAINKRLSGRSGTNTYTALETIWSILNITMLFSPIKLFLPLALFFFALGFVWGLPFVVMNRGVSVASAVLFLTGFLFLFIGLVVEQLSLVIRGRLED